MLVLMDRDGVLNVDRADYVKELELLPGAAEAVTRFNRAGWPVVVVTNQSAVGRGLVTSEMLERIHQHLRAVLARSAAWLDDIIVCTDPPWSAGPRRKPAPGMLGEALARYRVEPGHAMMIGDALRDLEAATAAGCRRVLVRTGQGRTTEAAGLPPYVLPVAVYEDLVEAADRLLEAPR